MYFGLVLTHTGEIIKTEVERIELSTVLAAAHEQGGVLVHAGQLPFRGVRGDLNSLVTYVTSKRRDHFGF